MFKNTTRTNKRYSQCQSKLLTRWINLLTRWKILLTSPKIAHTMEKFTRTPEKLLTTEIITRKNFCRSRPPNKLPQESSRNKLLTLITHDSILAELTSYNRALVTRMCDHCAGHDPPSVYSQDHFPALQG